MRSMPGPAPGIAPWRRRESCITGHNQDISVWSERTHVDGTIGAGFFLLWPQKSLLIFVARIS
jgi:hypothetical protein